MVVSMSWKQRILHWYPSFCPLELLPAPLVTLCSQERYDKVYEYICNVPDVFGVYSGDYGSHGTEIILITQRGYQMEALKLTGDPNIPRGKITWRCTLNFEDPLLGIGEIQLAGRNYTSPYWGNIVINLQRKVPRLISCTWEHRKFWLQPLDYVSLEDVHHFVEDAGTPDDNGNVDNSVVNGSIAQRERAGILAAHPSRRWNTNMISQ